MSIKYDSIKDHTCDVFGCMCSTYNEIFQFENHGFCVCYTSERKTFKSSKIKDIKKYCCMNCLR